MSFGAPVRCIFFFLFLSFSVLEFCTLEQFDDGAKQLSSSRAAELKAFDQRFRRAGERYVAVAERITQSSVSDLLHYKLVRLSL